MTWLDWVNLGLGITSIIIGLIGIVLSSVAVYKCTIINKNYTKIINSDNSSTNISTDEKKDIVITGDNNGINAINQHAETGGHITSTTINY